MGNYTVDGGESLLAQRTAQVLGVDVVQLVAAESGGSRAGFRVATDDDEHAAFLRLDDGGSGMSDTEFTLQREATILTHVRSAGLPVPEVLAHFDEPPATLLEYVDGTNRVSGSVADAVGAEYMGWIAEIHRLDPRIVPGESYASTSDAVRADLDWWVDRSMRDGLDARPLLGVAKRVLAATMPTVGEPPTFVHGDVGAGNFLVRDGRVTALLDWEMAHLGDPHEDLAWLWMRGAHSEFGDPQRRFVEYETAAGLKLDPDRLHWHLAFVMYKTAIALRSRLERPGSGRLVMTQFVLLTVYEALLGSALARLCGTQLSALGDVPTSTDTPEVRVIERLAEAVDVADREADRAVEHLRLAAAHRPWREERLAADIRAELNLEPDGLMAAISSADQTSTAALARVVGNDAGRACWALPPAVRRVQRAQEIGLGL